MFSLRRKHSMKKWKSDTPHKLQDGGDPMAIANAQVANIEGMDDGSGGPSPLEGAIEFGKGMAKTGGAAPGKLLKQGGATGRKLL